MSLVTKPMLAATCRDINKLDFNNNLYLATPKLDGIMALKIDGALVSRTFKPIRNKYIKNILEDILSGGADGEIVCGNFQETSSGVMSEDGKPDFVTKSLSESYAERADKMLCAKIDSNLITTLVPTAITSIEQLVFYEKKCVVAGFEGVCIRTSTSPYKCGRSTEKEVYLLKIKRFEDSEAIIIGFGERMHNENKAEKDNFGRTKRSFSKEGLQPVNTLGCLYVKDIKTNIEFEVGSGFDDFLHKQIWNNKEKWLGKIITYKHFSVSGVKDRPDFQYTRE